MASLSLLTQYFCRIVPTYPPQRLIHWLFDRSRFWRPWTAWTGHFRQILHWPRPRSLTLFSSPPSSSPGSALPPQFYHHTATTVLWSTDCDSPCFCLIQLAFLLPLLLVSQQIRCTGQGPLEILNLLLALFRMRKTRNPPLQLLWFSRRSVLDALIILSFAQGLIVSFAQAQALLHSDLT